MAIESERETGVGRSKRLKDLQGEIAERTLQTMLDIAAGISAAQKPLAELMELRIFENGKRDALRAINKALTDAAKANDSAQSIIHTHFNGSDG